MGPFNPESLATFPSRTTISRTNAYPQPLAAKSLATGLPSFETNGCGSGATATLDPETPQQPDLQSPQRTKPRERPKKTKNARKTSSNA